MKRLFCIMTAMILMLGLIPAAGTAETVLTEVRNDAQGFTTRMPEGKTATVNDQGQLNIWLEGEGFVPNVWICRRSDKVDPDKLLYESYPAYLKDKFGDRLLDVSASGKTLEIGGKILPAVAFIYADIHGNTVYRINLMEVRDDGDVEYQARFSEEDKDVALDALEAAIRYYQPDPASAAAGSTAPAELVKYSDGRFSMLLPKGWNILTSDEYANFAFKAWDPSNPDRCIFMFMRHTPILKSYAAREIYEQFNKITKPLGDNKYEFMAKACVLEVPDMEHYVKLVPEGAEYCRYFWSTGQVLNPAVYPEMNGAEVVRKQNGCYAIRATDNAGRKIEGTVSGTIVNAPFSNVINGVDCSFYIMYGFKGYTVPEGEMAVWGTTLADCLCSFSFEEQYVRAAVDVSEEDKEMLLECGRQMQEMHDAMVQAWALY